MRLALILGVLVGCPRRVPDHLRVEPEPTEAVEVERPETREALVAGIVGADPLVRAPTLPDPTIAAELDPAIGAWAAEVKALEAGEGDMALRLDQLEDRFDDTEVVPLARGYRLRNAENYLANLTRSDDRDLAIAALLTKLRPSDVTEGLTRSPLSFLGDDDTADARTYGERWVLTAWLADPELDRTAVHNAMNGLQYDGLSQTPIGRALKVPAGEGPAPAEAMAALARATEWSLQRVAADRDKEQAAWADTLFAAREALSTEDPESAELNTALDAFTSAAGAQSQGGALLTATALRWLGTCSDAPCGGFDRTEAMDWAERWDPELAKLARIWKVIALKDAVDTMDAGHASVLFPKAMVDLADALLGTGAGPIPMTSLRKARADQGVYYALGEAVGAENTVDWDSALLALRGHLADTVDRALELDPDPRFVPYLQRIRDRARK